MKGAGVGNPEGPDERIAELERELAALKSELALRTQRSVEGEDPIVAELLSDRQLLADLPDVIGILDREHRFLYLNRCVPGRRIAEFIGHSVIDFLREDERDVCREKLDRAWETGVIQIHESTSTGGYVWENRSVPIKRGGRVTHLLTTAVDVTRRKRVEEQLRQSEARLRTAIDATAMGTWSGGEGATHWDEAMCRIMGGPREESESFAVSKRVHEDDRQRVCALFAGFREAGSFDDLEFRVVRADGSIGHVLVRGTATRGPSGKLRWSGGAFDITARKVLEEQLRQAQKMDAIGQLTAGIAHNFNNILAIILPSVEICLRTAPPESRGRLEDIKHASIRGADMVRDLMLFARNEEGARLDAVDLVQSVRRTIDICRTTFDRGITLELRIGEGLPLARANAGKIEQVLLNLMINARDALAESKPRAPQISVTVERGGSDRLRLSVKDNGPGIDAAVKARIFEPFFTTKGDRGGTGIGLASAYAIILEHQGTLTCDSAPGLGTTFEIQLPLASPLTDRVDAPPASRPSGGNETILIIDDEAMFRRTTRDLLELEGYAVKEAGDGLAAITMLETELGRIDAVILDSSMPGVSGRVVLQRITELDPAVPVILLSGRVAGTEPAPLGATVLLGKPVSAEALLGTIRDALDRSSRRPSGTGR